jgi:hypothetical protein
LTFQVTGDNSSSISGGRRAWFDFLLPYQKTTNLLLCPVRTQKFKEFIQEYPTGPADLGISNYGMNFRVGGCDFGPWPYSKWPGVRGGARKPASVAYLTDGGSKPLNTTNPLKCVTETTPEKPGCWILHDPGDDAPNNLPDSCRSPGTISAREPLGRRCVCPEIATERIGGQRFHIGDLRLGQKASAQTVSSLDC